MVFYAVAKGYTPGIYTNWDEAKKMVNGFPNAKFKKFKTKREAIEFISDNSAANIESVIFESQKTISVGNCGINFNTYTKNDQIKTGDYNASKYNHLHTSQRQANEIRTPANTKCITNQIIQNDNMCSNEAKSFVNYEQRNGQVVTDIRSSNKTKTKVTYYAVAKGHVPGIYTDWETTKNMVRGYSQAIYKKFSNKKDAESFVKNFTFEDIPIYTEPIPNKTIIYTDGSFKEGLTGYGVVILKSNGDKYAIYGSVKSDKQTNNIGELHAIYIALLMVTGDVILYSDSAYSISVLTAYGNPNKMENKDLINKIKAAIGDRRVTFQHVKAHIGITLNEEADELADLGRISHESIIIIKNGERLQSSVDEI